jgi:Tfp pilus assembly protein PilF
MKNMFVIALFVLLIGCGTSYAGDREGAKILLSTAEKTLKDGDYSTAQSMCERALAEDKDFPKAHLVMGQILEAQSKAKEAIASYQLAAELAKKEKDTNTESQALAAAKKLAPGLLDIKQADQKLVDKLSGLASSAANESQLDTAKSAYQAVIALNPNNEEARKKLDEIQQKIDARGDPVKAKIAAAGLSEVWYKFGIGSKDEARKLAQEISSKYSDTPFGKDAAMLIESNFDVAKIATKDNIAEAKQQIKLQAAAAVKKPAPGPATPNTPATPAPHVGVDIDQVERTATDEAKGLAKDKIVPTFTDTFKKGKDFYSKATPGSEGNQKNVASALEQFIRCEALYMRIDQEKLMTPEVEDQEKDASMLRYACMKMTILSH